MQTKFDVYHSKEFDSFTLIESSKFKAQSVLLESDASLIDTFLIDHEKDDDVFLMAKEKYNQTIQRFCSQNST